MELRDNILWTLSVRFYTENGRCAFLSPIWEVRGNVRWSSYAYWKARSGLPISVKWTFSLGVTAEVLQANIGSKSAISLQPGPDDPKFQVEGVTLTDHSSSQKTRLNDLSYGIKIWTDLSSILSQSTHFTDRQTDRDGQTDSFLLTRPPCIQCSTVQSNTK